MKQILPVGTKIQFKTGWIWEVQKDNVIFYPEGNQSSNLTYYTKKDYVVLPDGGVDPGKNLKATMEFIAKQRVQSIDSALTEYIKSAIHLLELQGAKIEDYALIQIHNPMEFSETGARVVSQWRIVHVDKVRNLPVVGEGE